ncbi:MAG: hypothetical protein GY899_11840 [Verrucomicrobiaceae bacterium]|nr:hypothetical protein [Verrucomicrobiaceae bacterium]
MSETFASSSGESGVLIFDWVGSGRRPFWLLFFILLSCIGHLACFYLFRVVYPPQKRELVTTAAVTILDPSDLLTSRVLARIDDRVLALDSSDNMDSLKPLTSSGIRFSPFFEGYQPQLRELPLFEVETRNSLFPAGSVFLPPIDSPQGKSPLKVSKAPFIPIASIHWSDRDRAVLRDFEWVAADDIQRPADNDEALFYVGVDRFGQVIHAIPEQSAGAQMDSVLLTALRQMRFSPVKYPMLDWAWITFRW